MNYNSSLSHSKWDSKYHLLWIPKYIEKVLYENLRKKMRDIFQKLVCHRECKIHKRHLMCDHVHVLTLIPPKSSVSQMARYIKEKSAVHYAHLLMVKQRYFKGQSFLDSMILTVTAGRDEEAVREYI